MRMQERKTNLIPKILS
jgi:hypothetical protein